MKIFLSIVTILIYWVTGLSQEKDLSFKGFKSTHDKKVFFYLQADMNMSTIIGKEAKEYRNYINNFKQAYGLNVAKVSLRFGPSIQLLSYFNTPSLPVRFGTALKYHISGWREVILDKVNKNNLSRTVAAYSFHNLSFPLIIQYPLNDHLYIKGGYVPTIILAGKIVVRKKLVIAGQKETERDTYNFEEATGIDMQTFYSSFFTGIEAGTETIRFSGTMTVSTSFLKKPDHSTFKSIQLEIGIIYRLN